MSELFKGPNYLDEADSRENIRDSRRVTSRGRERLGKTGGYNKFEKGIVG